MSFKKITTSAAVIASLIATSIPLATSANAGGYRDYGHRGHSYSRHYDGPRHYHGPRHRYSHKHYKRHKRDRDVAKGLAIGLGVLAVGAIIANSR